MSMSQAFLSAGVSRCSWNEIAGSNTPRFQEFIAKLNPCGNEPISNAILIRLCFSKQQVVAPAGNTQWSSRLKLRLPAHNHVGLNRFSSLFEIGSRFLHVQPDSVHFVSRRFGKTVAGDATGV